MLIRTAFLAAGFIAATLPALSQTTLKAISTDASLVTGGDVLVELHTLAAKPAVTLNGTDVSRAFHFEGQGNYLALITGLRNGANTLRSGTTSLTLTNYPIEGPVFSGPRMAPFICQTNDFKLPDGTTLGKPLDENCSARTVVQYVYLPKNSLQFKSLKDFTKVPRDVAITTTASGNTVNFIVRVETGTMDRGIYQNAVLHDPTSEPQPTPFAPPRGWNHHLVALQGSGCPAGWYVQGSALGVSTLDRERLAQGDALFSNTLNHTSNSCNAILAGEATAMGKEHFIETFGVPDWTISIGGSGGAYTSLQIADAFPGLIDGVMIRATFPDALAIALAGLDAHLLMHYFQSTAPLALTGVQQAAIGGYPSVDAMMDAANQAQRTDPVPHRDDIKGYFSAMWKDAVPRPLRYDPDKNPTGARPTIFDWARNAYGVDPQTGFALRPFDNTGVQYGFSALNRGVITPTQFLDLNEKVGGVDNDSNYVSSRTQGNLDAIRRTYQSGLMLSGGVALLLSLSWTTAHRKRLAVTTTAGFTSLYETVSVRPTAVPRTWFFGATSSPTQHRRTCSITGSRHTKATRAPVHSATKSSATNPLLASTAASRRAVSPATSSSFRTLPAPASVTILFIPTRATRPVDRLPETS
nr:DUF6351 family protein [Terriglobus sp. TAA 43]